MTKILLHGANGAMGRELRALLDAGFADCTAGPMVSRSGNGAFASFSEIRESADVVLDFSFHTATESALGFALEHGLPIVIGTTGHTQQERARIEAIDSIAASVGDAQLVRDAKYGETPCTAEQLALKAMQKQAALGAKHLKDAKADNDESGAAGVGAAPNGGEEGSESDDKAKVDAIVGLYNSTKSQNGGKK